MGRETQRKDNKEQRRVNIDDREDEAPGLKGQVPILSLIAH